MLQERLVNDNARANADLDRLAGMLRDPNPVVGLYRDKLNQGKFTINYMSRTKFRSAAGYVENRIGQNGDHVIEIFYPEGNDPVFVEEFVHLMHGLENSLFKERALLRKQINDLTEEHGLRSFDPDIVAQYSTNFLSKTRTCIDEFARELNICAAPISKSKAARQLLNGDVSFGDSYLEFSYYQKVIDILSRVGFVDISIFDFTEYQNKNTVVEADIEAIKKIDRSDSRDLTSLEAMYDILAGHQTLLGQEKTKILQQFRNHLDKLDDNQFEKIYEVLGLAGLVELEYYQSVKKSEVQFSDEDLQIKILDLIKDNPRIIESIHYLLRPSGYSSYVVSNDVWLATKSSEERLTQIKDRMTCYNRESLLAICRRVLDENIFGQWAIAEADMTFAANSIFWDLSPDRMQLMFDPEYSRLNSQAIQKAISDGKIPTPSLLSDPHLQAEHGRYDQLRVLSTESQQLFDEDAMLGVNYQDSLEGMRLKLKSNHYSEDINWNKFFVSSMKNITDILYTNEQYKSAEDFIHKLSAASILNAKLGSLSTSLQLLTEIIAKSVKVYLTGASEHLVSPAGYGGYSILLTMHEDSDDSAWDRKSIWDGLINQIVDTLKMTESDGELLIHILRAKNMKELMDLVRYKSGPEENRTPVL